MDGYQYEHAVANYLTKKGYKKARVTQASGDYGIDVICEKDGHRYAVQCKYYSSPVGIEAVQQAVAGKAHYAADRAIVVTNNTYTQAAKTLAKDNNVLLYEWVNGYGKGRVVKDSDYRVGLMSFLVILAMLLYLALNMFSDIDVFATAAAFIALVLLVVFIIVFFLFFKSIGQPKKVSGYIITIIVTLALACFLWLKLGDLAKWLMDRPGANYIRYAIIAFACLVIVGLVVNCVLKIVRRKTDES